MVEGVYPIQPMSGDGVTTLFTAVWSASDIIARDPGRVDVSITGVQILPVLIENPSPTSTEGEYTYSDLAAINVGNYHSFYLQQPGVDIMDSQTDYATDLTDNVLTVQFAASAVYEVRVKTTSRGGAAQPLEQRDYLYTQFAGDDFGQDGARDAAGVMRKAGMPDADIYVVSDGDPKDNGFLVNTNATLTDQGKDVCRAISLTTAATCMCEKSTQLGRKVSVVLAGHGRPGSIKIGLSRINGFTDGTMTADAFQKLIDKCVSQITFFSCDTAKGAAGTTFLQDFDGSLGQGNSAGWAVPVTAAQPVRLLFKVRSGYFDTEATGKAKKGDETVVGGVTELQVGDSGPTRVATSGSGLSTANYAAIAGSAGMALMTLALGGLYARRRWLR
jgi:hypothetical protein